MKIENAMKKKVHRGWLYIASIALALLGLVGTSYTTSAQTPELIVLGQKIEDPLNRNASASQSGHNLSEENNWNGSWDWDCATLTLHIRNIRSTMEIEAIIVSYIPNFSIEIEGECNFENSPRNGTVICSLGCSIRILGENEKWGALCISAPHGNGITIAQRNFLLIKDCYVEIDAQCGIVGWGNGDGVGLWLSEGAHLEVKGKLASITNIRGSFEVFENDDWVKNVNDSSLARVTREDRPVKYSNGDVVYEESGNLVKEWVMFAPHYPIEVGGVKLHRYRTELTPESYPYIIRSGRVEYDPLGPWLYLYDATIESEDHSGIYSNHPSQALAIICYRSNKINAKDAPGIHTKDERGIFIWGEGVDSSLEIYSDGRWGALVGILNGSESTENTTKIRSIDLKISSRGSCIRTNKSDKKVILSDLNATLSSEAYKCSLISGFKEMEINDAYIASPLGAIVEDGTIKLNGTTLSETTCEIKRGKAPTYKVTIDPNIEHGKVEVTNYSGNLSKVPQGTQLEVEATPDTGYKLKKILAGGENITESKKFVVTRNAEISAEFEADTYNVAAKAPQNGKIAIKGYSDLKKVPYGTELTVEVTPNQGYTLAKLTANGADITATKKFVVKKATTVEATFALQTFAVTAKTPQNGKITIKGYADLKKVPYGTELTVEVTPNQGYTLAKLTANGADITATKKFVVKKATTVEATFALQTFAVTAKTPQNGKITIKGYSDLKKVPYGTELTVEVTPNQGYTLAKLTANGADITATKKFVVKKATTVEATFTKDTAIEDVATTEAILYPNPAEDAATLSGVEPGAVVQVLSLDGVEVLRTVADEAGVARLDLTTMLAGKYLVKSGKTTVILLVTK